MAAAIANVKNAAANTSLNVAAAIRNIPAKIRRIPIKIKPTLTVAPSPTWKTPAPASINAIPFCAALNKAIPAS